MSDRPDFPTPRQRWNPEEDWDPPEPDPVPVAPVEELPSFERRDIASIDEAALDGRRQLWRDTAVILSGVVAALLVANLVFPTIAGFASSSPNPISTGLTVGPSQSAAGQSRGAATASPNAAITLPPTGSAAPVKPRATPRPSATPTAPRATPRPSPAAAKPVANFKWNQTLP